MRYVLECMLKEASEPLEAPAAQKSAAPHNKCFSKFQLGMSQSGFGNAPVFLISISEKALETKGDRSYIKAFEGSGGKGVRKQSIVMFLERGESASEKLQSIH